MPLHRIRLALLVLTASLAVALIAIVMLADRGAGDPMPSSPYMGSTPPPGMPPSEFRLRDQDGRWTSLDQYRGKPVVVTFLYTSCKDTCPLIADQIRGALDRLGPNAPPAVAISTDPAADNPTTARAFLIKHHLLGRMRYLVGTRAELQPVWKRYAIQPQTPEWEHSAYVFVLDGTGRQRVTFPADRLTPEALAHDIRVVQSRQS